MKASLITAFALTISRVYSHREYRSAYQVLQPSKWGQKPHAISEVRQMKPLTGNLKNQATFLTNDSPDGWRIREQLVKTHNYVRKLESVTAPYMTKIVWDFHLEAYSRQWAEFLCNHADAHYFEHSPNKDTGIPAWPYRMNVGENLYTTTASRDQTDNFSDVVLKWYKEKEYFDWTTGKANRANTGKPVGHYKQLVRPQITTVGCTVVSGCHRNVNSGWKTFVVCHYDYGNLGKLPYQPTRVKRCSTCPRSFNCCEDGICSGYLDSHSIGFSPLTPATQLARRNETCNNHKRLDCLSVGGVNVSDETAYKARNFEFNNCYCGAENRELDFVQTVSDRLFWFRNHCYAGNRNHQSELNNSDSIYLQLSDLFVKKPSDDQMPIELDKNDQIYKFKKSYESQIHKSIDDTISNSLGAIMDEAENLLSSHHRERKFEVEDGFIDPHTQHE